MCVGVKSDFPFIVCILPCNALMVADRYMVIAFKSVCKEAVL